MSALSHVLDAIRPADPAALAAAAARQARLAKPAGFLGAMEDVAARLAGSAGRCPPPLPSPAAVAVFAGDHGVHARGVTPWPQEVTAQMVATFAAGGAVVNALARQVGASVVGVDVGVVGGAAPDGVLDRRVRRGTADITSGPAMRREEAVEALLVGAQVARELIDDGCRLLVAGDMGIANTTPAAALVCAFTGSDPSAATGRGTGVDDVVLGHKVDVVRDALALRHPDRTDLVGVLAASADSSTPRSPASSCSPQHPGCRRCETG